MGFGAPPPAAPLLLPHQELTQDGSRSFFLQSRQSLGHLGKENKEYQAGDEFKLVRPFGLVSKSAWQRLLGVTHVAIMAQWKGCSLWDLGMLR